MDFPEGSNVKALRGFRFFSLGPFLFSFHNSLSGKESNQMKKIIFLGWLIAFFPAMLFAQEKIEAPTWNVGDKWTFTGDGSVEVVKAEPDGFTLKFSNHNCTVETQGCSAILFDKSTRNRINAVDGDKRKKYVMALSKNLDFPLSTGKKWKHAYSSTSIVGGAYHPVSNDYSENYTVIGREDVEVRAGKFKAFKLEYKRIVTGSSSSWGGVGEEFKNIYWYSPDVKYFVKCQYDKDLMKGEKEIFNWELTSFQLKK